MASCYDDPQDHLKRCREFELALYLELAGLMPAGRILRFPILRGSHRLAGTKPTTNPPMVSSVFGEDDDDETNFKIKTFLEMI